MMENYRWFLARYNPVRDGKGQIGRWYVARTDIDDRKRDEYRLRQENIALREESDKTSMFEDITALQRQRARSMFPRMPSKFCFIDSSVGSARSKIPARSPWLEKP
jgi:hypothetical protein